LKCQKRDQVFFYGGFFAQGPELPEKGKKNDSNEMAHRLQRKNQHKKRGKKTGCGWSLNWFPASRSIRKKGPIYRSKRRPGRTDQISKKKWGEEKRMSVQKTVPERREKQELQGGKKGPDTILPRKRSVRERPEAPFLGIRRTVARRGVRKKRPGHNERKNPKRAKSPLRKGKTALPREKKIHKREIILDQGPVQNQGGKARPGRPKKKKISPCHRGKGGK